MDNKSVRPFWICILLELNSWDYGSLAPPAISWPTIVGKE
jgi:hypothetical protein